MLLKNIAKGTMGLRDVNACPYGLGHFFPRPNGQFLILGGFRTLASRMVCAFFSSFWQYQRPDEKIGSEKNTPRCPFDRHFFESNVFFPFFLFRLIEIQIENEWLEIVQLSHPIRRW